jgi:hypothetical protein
MVKTSLDEDQIDIATFPGLYILAAAVGGADARVLA